MRVVYTGGEGEITEKKSRFIATVKPVQSEEEAVAFINETKKKYWDARHNCSAFVIGERQELTRCSDDGEPAQTAGRPMLDVLLREKITDVAVVVTRYFGGVLLGTGGLVRAYQAATQAGLAASRLIDRWLVYLRIPALQTTQIARIIHDLEQSLDSREYANELYHKLLFLDLMVQLNRAALSNRIEYLSTTASNHKMINVIDYLNAHLTDDITIDFLAEHFYLSRYHLMHAFKEETGYTIGNYLTTKRLLLARDQIAQGESITTACYACGFHNYSTFSRAYRKHFGCSPREQRN